VHEFERWARRHLPEGFSLDHAAVELATSKRTLARRMQSVLGKTPLDYFQDLRIERTVHLLETSQASVDQIATEVGYAEGVTLRGLLPSGSPLSGNSATSARYPRSSFSMSTALNNRQLRFHDFSSAGGPSHMYVPNRR
jgi:AraC-like DNA-binding protein